MSGGFTYWLGVDQSFCIRRKISLRDGAVIGYLKSIASESWVKRFDGDWMWMASAKLAEQLPMICTSDRTVERIWSSLRSSGVVETKLIGNRQCFKFTEIADEWNKQVSPQVAEPRKKVSPKVAAAPAKSGGAGVAKSGGEVSPQVAGNKSTTKISNTSDKNTNNTRRVCGTTSRQQYTNPDEHPEYQAVVAAWKTHGNGQVKPRDIALYIKHVHEPGLTDQFLIGAQNYLNDKQPQTGARYQNLDTFIREESWLMFAEVKPGPIHLEGAPEPVAEATDDEKRKAEVRAARIERRQKLREEGII